jgi:hypothetical protein
MTTGFINGLCAVIGTMTARQAVSQAALGIVQTINRNVRRALNTQQDYFLQDATMVRSMQISYSTEQGIAYLNTDDNTQKMFNVIGTAVADRAPIRSG